MVFAQVIGWTVGAIVVGALMYPLLQLARAKEWCRFVGQTPHEYKVTLLIPQACLLPLLLNNQGCRVLGEGETPSGYHPASV